MSPRGDYRSLAIDEGKHAKSQPAVRRANASSQLIQLLQWVCVVCLILIGGVVLGAHHRGISPGVLAQSTLAPSQGKVRKRKAHQTPSIMWAFGSSGHLGAQPTARSRRKAVKRQAAKAAKRSVLLIGSHFRQGSAVLEQLFDEWCAKPRLALRCENSWAGKHDLAALAAHNGPWRRRLVWLERDAPTMLRTLRGVSKFTQNVQFVQVVWDPLDACVGQWPLAQRSNRSVAAACAGLRLDTLVPLHQRTKRDPKRAMTIALRELASVGTAEAALRRLVDFLALPDAGLDLEASAAKIVARLSPEVRDAPPEWARAAVAQNSTLRSWLSGLRQALELKGAR
jgi:hypothetical protein